MKLDRIQVTGFKRLCDASAYFGRKTVAIVGPNEAGKSSLLQLFEYLNDSTAIPPTVRSRQLPAEETEDDDNVAVASFLLSDQQLELIADFPLSIRPGHYAIHKKFGGDTSYSFLPAATIDPKLLKNLKASWEVLARFAAKQLDSDDRSRAEEELEEDEQTSYPDHRNDLEKINRFVEANGPSADSATWRSLDEWLKSRVPSKPAKNLAHGQSSLATYVEWHHNETKLNVRFHDKIQAKRPKFVLFEERFRRLKDEYNLEDEDDVADPALINLLRVGGSAPEQFAAVRADSSRRHTLQTRVNARLKNFFVTAWGQAKLAVEVSLEGSVLHILVADLSDGLHLDQLTSVRITDRSDGLRMFVCLASFLASREDDLPPILLIDEAEQHLHLNAQADLVRLLQSAAQVSQVIYTTHSPGCLPSDLGSGVRFVEPDPSGQESSVIRHDFWSLQGAQASGFSPLLLVMGAGSAAFASLRYAVVAEGPSDMLLLPLMIRTALRADELDYQVAPGISVASKESMRQLELSAAKVVYVVDGDAAGIEWKKQLDQGGVDSERIHNWPGTAALEDLLDPDYYIGSLNLWLEGTGEEIRRSELVKGPIKSAAENWHKAHKMKMPGSISVAEFLLGRHESGESPLLLSKRGETALQNFHRWALEKLDIQSDDA